MPIDLLTIRDFLDAPTLTALLAELRGAEGAASRTLGRGVQATVRRSTRVKVATETIERIVQGLRERKAELEAHFGVTLTDCEEPQFLRYHEGDFFVAHQDGNTPMIWDESRFRRVSVVAFLSSRADEPAPGCHGGGELVFHGHYATEPDLRVIAPAEAGSLVAFRAETTHEVLPVIHGRRFTVVSWFRGV